MTRDQNIFVARRNIVDYIWKSARLEGMDVTFPQTYAIYERAKLKNVDVDTVLKITNLKYGWNLILDNIDSALDLGFICRVHGEVARGEAPVWGALRTGKVRISGTDYMPPVPDKAAVTKSLAALLDTREPTERAIEVMLWAMKSQLFWDGNKRTSMMIANKIMIENGCGIISVPIDLIDEFSTVLSDYHSNDTLAEAKQYVYDHCIDGIDFEPAPPQTQDDDEEELER